MLEEQKKHLFSQKAMIQRKLDVFHARVKAREAEKLELERERKESEAGRDA